VPDALDKVNTDALVDTYGDITGIPVGSVRDEEQVEEMRAARAQQQQMMMAQEQAQMASQTAKNLGDTPVDNNSALDAMVEQSDAGAIV